MTNLKESKCERCGDLFDRGWCPDDQMERDVCQMCQEHIDAEEGDKEKLYD